MSPTLLDQKPFPQLNLDGLSTAEKTDTSLLAMTLGSLHLRIRDFLAGLEVFNLLSEQQRLASGRNDHDTTRAIEYCRLVPARDCAMTIYHFGRVIDGIHDTLPHCPGVMARIDREKLRAAKKLFLAAFPDYVPLRHAVAHSAETASSPKGIKKHALHGPKKLHKAGFNIELGIGGSMIMSGNVLGTKFSSMWEGQIFSCDLTMYTASQLEAIQTAYWEVFAPTAKAI